MAQFALRSSSAMSFLWPGTGASSRSPCLSPRSYSQGSQMRSGSCGQLGSNVLILKRCNGGLHLIQGLGDSSFSRGPSKARVRRRKSVTTCSIALTDGLGGQESIGDGDNFNGAAVEKEEEKFTLSRFGAGILEDAKRRYKHYLSDFTDGVHPKAAAATFFLYFACLTPCLAFGGLMATVTGNSIGVVESLIGTAVSGVLYAMLAAQPLTLLGPTGLMVIFTGLLYKATVELGLPFLPVYGWVGLWSFAFLFVLAAVEASNLIKHFTRFTDDIFSSLISFGFISEACKSIGALFKASSPFSTATALLSFVLAGGTWILSTFLTQMRSSRLLVPSVRNALSDFGPPLAILLMSLVPPILFPGVVIPELPIPSGIATTSGRPWIVPFFSVPAWVIAASSIPAALLTLLIFLDQNITSRLINDPKNKLKKGEGYHLDLFVLGALMAVGSLFGLPWMVASTVPSLSHVRSLSTISKSISISGENSDIPDETVVGVIENRLTGVTIHVLIGASLLLLPILRFVPVPVTSGLFLYMGFTSLSGNQFVERLKLWVYDPELYPEYDFTKSVPRAVLHGFTALQLVCLTTLWTLKKTSWGITFPLLILALMPIRNYVAGSLFSREHLNIMDSH
ncbi:hypothetical protein MPTK1_6g01490 [Marchantia polymorpha subsp. ruderalis]|uniref:Bicarbonate transporter-like transmembrane domain-containing protein n=2 Tax=Marchantia polymorpha TaxID=3197 RepID=A0AAF6BMF1_MARPO|nr:hypothetical protein MARPO_0052s0055 [Marchantia polymorpha]BBN13185.1 hypothetical protein Mp_6g01490 [Marchantia polymorpha subsp. ruderalis]|eukprot:PTQ38262.1 hypothetical protein MARPO_0052s0055 [Marchantia polymorpha]